MSATLEVILDAIRDRMRRDGRSATDAEIEEVRKAHADAVGEFNSSRMMRGYGIAMEVVPPPPDWGQLYVELTEKCRHDLSERQPVRRPGPRSKWRRAVLESITKGLAADEKLRSIERATKIRHQRISELRARGDVYWDERERRLRTPPGTVSKDGWVILPPRR